MLKLNLQYFAHLMQRTNSLEKDPDAGKDSRQEKGTTEDEMLRWHHQVNGCEFEQALEVGNGQGILACCSPWGHKESDTTEWLNWTEFCKCKNTTRDRNTMINYQLILGDKLESRLLGEISIPQICRWHHPYGRKWRGTKKPLDKSESGEWKSWLKAQRSLNEDHGIWSHHFVGNRWGNSVRLYFWGLQNHCRWWLQPWN